MPIMDGASVRLNRFASQPLSSRSWEGWGRLLPALFAVGAFACDSPAAPDGGAQDAHVAMDAARPDASAADSGTSDGGFDAGRDASGPTDAGHDASTSDAGPPGLVAVSHPRELRAVWVSSVFRLDFPSSTSLTEAQARAELGQIVDVSAAAGFNTILFQVRPESDALYASLLEPWSRFVSGTQGTNPGYDPLAILIELAHARGIAVDAWINPYRAKTSTTTPTHPQHVTQRFPNAAITFGTSVVMDPSDAEVRAHVVDVIHDLTRRYDIDGVIVDDYFYPYGITPSNPFPDDAQYAAYVDGGGILSKSDWRRENVNALMSAAASVIKGEKPWVRWGAAPFGIYQPGMPPGITGTNAYEVLACDSLRWLDEGWVDYIAPQLYWPTDSDGQAFGLLIDWWAAQATPERPVIPSLAVYKMADSGWTANEMREQVGLTRDEAPNSAGHTWFRYAQIASDAAGERALLADVYAKPALPPVVPGMGSTTVAPPTVTAVSGGLSLGHTSIASIRGYAVYRWVDDSWSIERWVPAASRSVTLPAGRYAVTAVGRGEVESLGVDVTLR